MYYALITQVEIAELEQKLLELRNVETNCSEQINSIDNNIDSIKQDFQPRLSKVEEERKENSDKETEVQKKIVRTIFWYNIVYVYFHLFSL